jgi:hypothetical protein
MEYGGMVNTTRTLSISNDSILHGFWNWFVGRKRNIHEEDVKHITMKRRERGERDREARERREREIAYTQQGLTK